MSLRRWNLALALVVTLSGFSLDTSPTPVPLSSCTDGCIDKCADYDCVNSPGCTKSCPEVTCYDNLDLPHPYQAECIAQTL